MMDVYIYKLDLNVETPVVEKFLATIRTGARGDDEVIRWVGPNDYRVWHTNFYVEMICVVYEPIDNIIELIVKRDEVSESEAIMMIEQYCSNKATLLRKKIDTFYRGIGATIQFRVTKVKKSEHLFGLRATAVIIDDFDPPEIPPVSRPIDITDDQFDGDPVLIIPGPFEGEEDV